MFTLRPATENDSAAIRWLVHTGNINPTGLDWRRFVVAVNGEGRVIGCGQVKTHRDRSREIASIAVHPEHRRRGVARAIVAYLVDTYPGDLYLMCRSELGSMYEKFGFRSLQPMEMPRYFRRLSRMAGFLNRLSSQGVSLLVMQRG